LISVSGRQIKLLAEFILNKSGIKILFIIKRRIEMLKKMTVFFAAALAAVFLVSCDDSSDSAEKLGKNYDICAGHNPAGIVFDLVTEDGAKGKAKILDIGKAGGEIKEIRASLGANDLWLKTIKAFAKMGQEDDAPVEMKGHPFIDMNGTDVKAWSFKKGAEATPEAYKAITEVPDGYTNAVNMKSDPVDTWLDMLEVKDVTKEGKVVRTIDFAASANMPKVKGLIKDEIKSGYAYNKLTDKSEPPKTVQGDGVIKTHYNGKMAIGDRWKTKNSKSVIYIIKTKENKYVKFFIMEFPSTDATRQTGFIKIAWDLLPDPEI